MGQAIQSGPWQDELENAILSQKFNKAQHSVITQNASPALQPILRQALTDNDNKKFGHEIAHSIIDPIRKTVYNISLALELKEDQYVEKNLTRMKLAMTDIIHNAENFLGDNTPQSTQKLIDLYKEKLNDLDRVINPKTAQEHSKGYAEGFDHLYSMPEDFKDLGI